MKQEVKKKPLEPRSDPSQAPINATMALAAGGKNLLYFDLPSLPKYPSNFDDLTSHLESWDQDFLFLPNENDNTDQGGPAILDLLARRLQETRTERDHLAMEAVDLRDRNELLEFRVLELEEQQEQQQQHVCRPESRRSPRLEDSLHESGIFDGDAWSDSGSSGVLGSGGSCLSRETQTESPQLGAEIERLGRVRAQIENNSATSKELGFYKARLEQVEARLEVLLASPEEQLRLLARRLEREAQLSAETSWLQQQISRLEARVEYLEMENSELQELENDARFKCQQMEANANMYCQTAERIRLLEETIRSYEERNYELEENEIELRDRLEFMERLLPAVILWNLYSKLEKPTHSARPLCLQSSKLNNFDSEVTRKVQDRIKAVEAKINQQCKCYPNALKKPESILEINYVAKLKALSQTEAEVRCRMEALEQKEMAYFETLNQYDAIFAAMEADFNQKLATSQASEEELRSRIQKLESESGCSCSSSDQNSDVPKYDEDDDVDDLTLHNNRLEESIRALRCRLHSLEQDKRKQAERMNSELEACRTRVHDVLENVEGPLKKQLERANCRVNQLTTEIEDSERQMRLMADEYEEQEQNCSCSMNSNDKELSTSQVDKTKERSQKCPPPPICHLPIESALKSPKQKCPFQIANDNQTHMNKKPCPPPPICPAQIKSSKPPPKPKFQACGCREKPPCPPKKKECTGSSKETGKCAKKKQDKSDTLNDRCLKMFQLKSRIAKLSRELQHTECNNGELREEVETLEAAVAELKQELDRQTEEHAKERSELLANQTELKAEIASLHEQSISQNNDEASMRLSDELAAAVKQENYDYVDEPPGDLEETTKDINNPVSDKEESEENEEELEKNKEESEENKEESGENEEESEGNKKESEENEEESEENKENPISEREATNGEIKISEPPRQPSEIKENPKENVEMTTVTIPQTNPGLSDSMNDLMDKLNIALTHLTECDSCTNLVGPTLEAILGDLSVVALEIDHTAPPGLPPVEICCFEPKCITEINQYRKEIYEGNLTEEENDDFKSCIFESESEIIIKPDCLCVKEKKISTQKNCNNKKTASDCEKLFALARILTENQTNSSSNKKMFQDEQQLPNCCKPIPPCRKPPKECGQPSPACCKPPPCPIPPPPPKITETCDRSFSNIPPIKIHHYELCEHETLLGKELADLAIKFKEQDKKSSIQCTTCRKKHSDTSEDIQKEDIKIGDIKKETEEAIEQIKRKISDAPKEELNEFSEVVVKQESVDLEQSQSEPIEEVIVKQESVELEQSQSEPNEEVIVKQEPAEVEESQSEKEDTPQIQQESSESEYQDVKQETTDTEPEEHEKPKKEHIDTEPEEHEKPKKKHISEKTCGIANCQCCICVQTKTEATSTSCLSVSTQAKPACCKSSQCASNQKSSCPPPPPPLPSCCKSPSCARNIRESLKNCLPPPPPPKFCPPLIPKVPRYKLKQTQNAPCQNNESKSNISENNSQFEIPKTKSKSSRNKHHSSHKKNSYKHNSSIDNKSHSCCQNADCPVNVHESEENKPLCCKMLKGKKKSSEDFLPRITSTTKHRNKSPPCWNPKLNKSNEPPPPPKKFNETEQKESHSSHKKISYKHNKSHSCCQNADCPVNVLHESEENKPLCCKMLKGKKKSSEDFLPRITSTTKHRNKSPPCWNPKLNKSNEPPPPPKKFNETEQKESHSSHKKISYKHNKSHSCCQNADCPVNVLHESEENKPLCCKMLKGKTKSSEEFLPGITSTPKQRNKSPPCWNPKLNKSNEPPPPPKKFNETEHNESSQKIPYCSTIPSPPPLPSHDQKKSRPKTTNTTSKDISTDYSLNRSQSVCSCRSKKHNTNDFSEFIQAMTKRKKNIDSTKHATKHDSSTNLPACCKKKNVNKSLPKHLLEQKESYNDCDFPLTPPCTCKPSKTDSLNSKKPSCCKIDKESKIKYTSSTSTSSFKIPACCKKNTFDQWCCKKFDKHPSKNSICSSKACPHSLGIKASNTVISHHTKVISNKKTLDMSYILPITPKESYNDCDFPLAPHSPPPPTPPPFPYKPSNTDSLNSKKPSCCKMDKESKIKCTSTSTSSFKIPVCCKKNTFDQRCCKKFDKHPNRCPHSLGIKAINTVITPYTKVVSNGKTLDMSYILPIPPPPVFDNSRKYSNCKPKSREYSFNSGSPPEPPPLPSPQTHTYFHQRTLEDSDSTKPCCVPKIKLKSDTNPPPPPPIPEIIETCCQRATCPLQERKQSKPPLKDKSKCCTKSYCPSQDTTVMPVLISYTFQNEKKLMDSRNQVFSFKKKEVKSQGVSVALNRHEFGDIPSMDSVSRVVFRCDPEDICRLDDHLDAARSSRD